MPQSVIVAGARTPIGRLLGGLKSLSGSDLGGHAIKGALEKAGVSGDQVDYVIMGQVLQAGAGQIPARQAADKAGIPLNVPALTVNKVCLSGINAIALADQLIRAGEHEIIVAGGQESMTQAPHMLLGSREGTKYGDTTLVDHMQADGLWDAITDQAMGGLTESINAEKQKFTREEQDAFSARSHQLAAEAQKNGVFDDEIVSGRDPAAHGRPDRRQGRRGRARRHHGRVPRQAASGVLQGGHHHGRLRQPDLRRRVCRRRDEQGEGRVARAHLARRDRRQRPGRRPGLLAAVAAGQRDRPGLREGGHLAVRPRPRRDQRGVRRRRHRLDPRARHQRGHRQRQRWRHRARSPDRHERCPPGAAPRAGAQAPRWRRRSGRAVWRRRPGRRPDRPRSPGARVGGRRAGSPGRDAGRPARSPGSSRSSRTRRPRCAR